MIMTSNRNAVEHKRAFIKSAIAEAQSMKFSIMTFDPIVARLAELKAGICEAQRVEDLEIPFPDAQDFRELRRHD
jgi:hypothetical protein